jgi:hypothetical protein
MGKQWQIGDSIIVIHPWIARLSIIVIFMIGVVVGVSISYFSALHFVEVVGQSFKVESMNTTISINQSMIMDAIQGVVNNMNESKGI